MSLDVDSLYKALTRPPMFFGVPLVPLFISFAVFILLAIWFNWLIFILFIPVYFALRITTKIDEKVFQVIGMKRFFLKYKILNASYKRIINANFYSSIDYSEKQTKGINNKDNITMLNNKKSIPIKDLIPFSSQLSDTVVLNKDGYLMSTWVVEGISFETREDENIDAYKYSLNTLLISLAQENLAFYFHNIKDFTKYNLTPVFNNDFAREINQEYINSFKKNEFMENKLFVTVVFKKTRAEKINAKFSSKEEKKSNTEIRLEQFNDLCGRIESALNKFSIYKLSCYQKDDATYSQQLEFYNYLLSLHYQPIRVLDAPIYSYLGNNELSKASKGVLKVITPEKTTYMKSIEIKDWVSYTKAGFLDELINFPCRYIITQSFSVLPKNVGKSSIDRQLKQLKSTEDDALTQVNSLEDAKDQLMSGELIMGEHHFTAFLFADSEAEINNYTNQFITSMNDLGFVVTLNWLAPDEAYYGQLPSQFMLRHKVSEITSLNFIGLNSLHNNPTGKQKENCWGNAVALLKTAANQPFYFNFHQTRVGRNDLDQKHLGHTLMLGKSGTGKTMTLSFFLNQLTQYEDKNSFAPQSENKNFTAIYFDKDYGAEINIRALGGQYFSLKNGELTGFNPFMCESTQLNIEFICSLIEMLATPNDEKLTVKEKTQISDAVNAVMREEIKHRIYGISLLLENIQDDYGDDNNIRKRLAIWKKGNSYGWVFDNEYDLLSFENKNIYGFDGTEILDNKNIVAPISFYILHRIEQIADGRRLAIFMDEFWKWLQGEAFKKFVYDGLKTLRKRNGFLVGATQSPDEILKSDIARAIIEQVETFIFLPNSKADHDEYVKGFQVSDKEYNLIKNLADDSRQFLIKKGNGGDGDSRGNTTIAKLDLSGVSRENLKILSASIDNVNLVHSLIEEEGDDPKKWLPLFKGKCV